MSGPDLSVVRLWRYPVKSLGGEAVEVLPLTAEGVLGDRRYAIALRDTGRILTAKRAPQLLDASARWRDGRVELSLPDGHTVTSDDPAVDDVLTEWLGEPVRLEHAAGQVRRVADYAGDPGDPGSVSSFDLPAWGFADEAPLHLLSEATLRLGRARYPEGDWDERRFRPNVLLGGSGEGSPETDLAGQLVQLGEVALSVTGVCRRCVLITQPQRGLPRDRRLLRAVIEHFEGATGVYAEAVTTGLVRLGDRVTPLPSATAAPSPSTTVTFPPSPPAATAVPAEMRT